MGDTSDNDNLLKINTVDDMSDVEDVDLELEEASNVTEKSGSDYIGVGGSGELPDYVWFGEKECRCIFSLDSDKGAFQRVCGNLSQRCSRAGHGIIPKADVGYYQPAKARKFVDGKLETLIGKEEYEKIEANRRFSNREALVAAGEYLGRANAGMAKIGKVVTFGDDGKAPVSGGTGTVSTSTGSLKEEEVVSWNLIDSHETKPSFSASRKRSVPDSVSPSVDSEALMKLMEMLSVSMTNLNEQMTRMDSNQQRSNELLNKAINDQKRYVMTAGTPPPSSAPTEGGLKSTPTSTMGLFGGKGASRIIFYAVARGKEGVQGIFTSWGEVAPVVLGVSNAIYQKFDTRAQAEGFIQRFNQVGGKSKVSRKKKWYVVSNTATGYCGIFDNGLDADKHTVGVSCATSYGFNTKEEAQQCYEAFKAESENSEDSEDTSEGFEGVERLRGGSALWETERPELKDGASLVGYPPAKLMGQDDSTGKEEEAFGLDLSCGESELRKVLTPGFLSEDQKKGLLNNVTDAVALPGMFCGMEDSDQSSSNEMTMLGEAMEELVNQKRHGGEQLGRSDLHWRTDRRISLQNIKSLNDLFKRVTTLQKLEQKVRKRMLGVTGNACKYAGITDASKVHSWSNYGWLTTIVMRTLSYYIGLHQHLLCNGQTSGWDYIQVEKDHFLEELRLIRHTADSRIHCICLQYALLRDGHKNNWFNSNIQQSRNLLAFGHPSGALSMRAGTAPPSEGICPKCLTTLHGPNSDFCPWKNQSDENARKNAAQTLRSMGKSGNKKE